MTLERYVRLASSIDTSLVRGLGATDLGWALSAHYALAHRQGLASQIEEVGRLIIDPLTARMDPELGWSVARDGELKPAYRELLQQYLVGIDVGYIGAKWQPGSDAERELFAANVLRFQGLCLDAGLSFERQLFDIDELPTPKRRIAPDELLGPYLLVRERQDLAEQVALYRNTPRQWEGIPVSLVLAVHPPLLRDLALVREMTTLDLDGARIWLALPDFRNSLTHRSGPTIGLRARTIVKALAGRGPVGLLGAGFALSTLASNGVGAIAFGLHIAGDRQRKGSGGPWPYTYATAVHGWTSYREAAAVVSECRTPHDLAHWFCAEETCVRFFDEVGPREFARRMFSTRPGADATVYADPGARRLQDEHGLRARLFELDLMAGMTRPELARQLAAEARRSPFLRPARELHRWAAIMTMEETLAA